MTPVWIALAGIGAAAVWRGGGAGWRQWRGAGAADEHRFPLGSQPAVVADITAFLGDGGAAVGGGALHLWHGPIAVSRTDHGFGICQCAAAGDMAGGTAGGAAGPPAHPPRADTGRRIGRLRTGCGGPPRQSPSAVTSEAGGRGRRRRSGVQPIGARSAPRPVRGHPARRRGRAALRQFDVRLAGIDILSVGSAPGS